MAEQWTGDDVRKIACNPLYVAKGVISEEQFIDMAERDVKESGLRKYLETLLENVHDMVEVYEGGEIPEVIDPFCGSGSPFSEN